MKMQKIATIVVISGAIMSAACTRTPGGTTIADRSNLRQFSAMPATLAANPGGPTEDMISLGRMLYFDARLSRSHTISCNSCHPLDQFGADRQPTSLGYKGERGTRNSPTVYNAGAQFAQFWDGRSPDLVDQAKGPLLNPVEMGMPSPEAVVDLLQSIPGYVAAFQRAYPGDSKPLTFDHVAQAIAAFEGKLVTPSRWDQFLGGNEMALSRQEKGGFNIFVQEGCANCHTGLLVGGNGYQRLGKVRPYPDDSDMGRYGVTKSAADRMVFKIPSLRNIAMTGPYFHNGTVGTLQEAVMQMAEYQLGKSLPPRQIDAIVTWMESLTGDAPADLVKAPKLPSSSPETPKPVVPL